MLRVLTLASLFPDAARPTFGGFVERQTLTLAARDDVELRVVAPIGMPPWPLSRHAHYRRFDEVPLTEEWQGVPVHRPRFRLLPGIGGRRNAAAMARRLLPLLRGLREAFPFDVIDAEFFYPDGPAAARLAESLGVPFSVKARGADIHYWAGQPGCREQILDAGERADGLLAVSEALKRDMIALGLPGEKIDVHYTGIDRERFKPADRGEARRALGVEGPLLLSVGALIPRKRHDLVIEALGLVPDATLLIAGEGEERGALAALAARLGVGGRVRLLGNRPHDEVARLMAAADVLILASSSEGLANVLVEALASGTPVVTGDVGGAREAVNRPEAGAVIELDPPAIAQAVSTLLADPPAQEAVRATVDDFSWERNAEQLYEHLASIAERH